MKTILSISICFFIVVTIDFFGYSQTIWTKYSDNPVLTKGPAGFDIIAIGQPTALFENDTIKLWYAGVGTDMKARICYAYSTDGILWVKHPEPVIDVGSAGQWDCGWMDTPEIVKDQNGYKLYYYGDTVQQFAAISSAIGLATSADGIHWSKHPGNPVFTKGNPGEWDGSWVESPTVIFEPETGVYKMWYNGIDTSTWKIQIGLATSTDGFSWTKYFNNPVISTGNWGTYDDIWLGTPTAILSGNLYEIWYSATSTASYNPNTQSFDTISICYATSSDGISWTKHQNNPLFNTFSAPYDSLIDKGGPWAPCVIYNGNTQHYFMLYESFGANTDYHFSLATSPKSNSGFCHHFNNNKDIGISYDNNTILLKSNQKLENAICIIYHITGQTVYYQTNINSETINIDAEYFPEGVLLIQLINKKKIQTAKFILSH